MSRGMGRGLEDNPALTDRVSKLILWKSTPCQSRVILSRFSPRRLLEHCSGATATEYALFAALVAVVVIGVIVSGTLPK